MTTLFARVVGLGAVWALTGCDPVPSTGPVGDWRRAETVVLGGHLEVFANGTAEASWNFTYWEEGCSRSWTVMYDVDSANGDCGVCSTGLGAAVVERDALRGGECGGPESSIGDGMLDRTGPGDLLSLGVVDDSVALEAGFLDWAETRQALLDQAVNPVGVLAFRTADTILGAMLEDPSTADGRITGEGEMWFVQGYLSTEVQPPSTGDTLQNGEYDVTVPLPPLARILDARATLD